MAFHTAQEIYELFGRRSCEGGAFPTLTQAFPYDAEVLVRLKSVDEHFRSLAERYQVLTRSIARIESKLERASYRYLKQLKGQRLMLLDAIALIVEQTEAYPLQGTAEAGNGTKNSAGPTTGTLQPATDR